jgi:ABC-2 type transport system permease protein
MWESNKLFVASPMVLSGLLLVVLLWVVVQVPAEVKAEGISSLAALLDGASPFAVMIPFMPLAIPFVVVLYLCSLIYLVNALYHDRKDGSILFWQSMPVSNLETVLSKIVTVSFVAPLITAAASGVLILFVVLALSVLGASYDVESIGFWTLLTAGLYSVLLIYLTAVLAALWLFPTTGWILLFSAYARSLPFLWALGGFILLLFLEDFIFGSQFLGNWLQSRAGGQNYIIFSVADFFQRLFSYDLLIGVLLGSLLVTGAVYMRRFAD